MSAGTNAERATATLVYVGRRLDAKGKVRPYFITSWGSDPDDFTTWSTLKGAGGRAIGATYEVEHDGDPADGVYLASMRFVDDGDQDPETRAQWSASDQAAQVEADAAAAERKARDQAQDDIDQLTLAEARDWIQAGRGGQRAARRAVVLAQIGWR